VSGPKANVDTREKIVSAERLPELLAHEDWVAVVGWFDPMTAAEAERLAGFARLGKVLGIVLADEQALLPVAARAALVASLRDVSAVLVAAPGTWPAVLPKNAVLTVFEDFEGEGARRREFIELVRNRQQQE
jgi:hypothetical protein